MSPDREASGTLGRNNEKKEPAKVSSGRIDKTLVTNEKKLFGLFRQVSSSIRPINESHNCLNDEVTYQFENQCKDELMIQIPQPIIVGKSPFNS